MAPPQGGGGGRGVIQGTQQEKQAIDRLKAMGFPEHAAVEAYMVCDKNEELAANYLFNAQDAMFGGAVAAQPAAAQPAAAQQPAADAAAQPEQAQGDNNNADADNSGDNNDSGDASGDSGN